MKGSASSATTPFPRIGFFLALLVVALGLTLTRSFYERLAADAFFSLTVAGFAIVFLSVSAKPWSDSLRLLVSASFFAELQMWVLKLPFKLAPALALLGMSALLLLAVRWVWSQGETSSLLRYAMLPPFLLVLSSYLGPALLGLVGSLHPRTFDPSLYNFDQSLGVQLSCRIGQVVLGSHRLKSIAFALYYALPLAGIFVYGRQLLRERNFASTAFLSFLVAGPVGLVFYNMVPGCGPICLLGSRFPFDPPSLLQLQQSPLPSVGLCGPRNAFPSLHMAWAVLAWWYSACLSWRARLPVFAFLVGTSVAILAVGEHYFVDLVAALPFALMVEAGCALQVSILDWRRFVPFICGLTLLLGWVALLRIGFRPDWTNPVAAWMLVVFTVAVSLRMHAVLRGPLLQSSNHNLRQPSAVESDSSARRQ